MLYRRAGHSYVVTAGYQPAPAIRLWLGAVVHSTRANGVAAVVLGEAATVQRLLRSFVNWWASIRGSNRGPGTTTMPSC